MSDAPSASALPTWQQARKPHLARMFSDRVAATPTKEAFRAPDDAAEGGWRSLTWAEADDVVRRRAAGLVALGVQPEQRVAIAADTSLDWVLDFLAIISSAAACTTIYSSTIADDACYIVGDAEVRVVFAEDEGQLAKLRDRRSELPTLTTAVLMSGEVDETDVEWVITNAELERRGAELLASDKAAVDDRIAAIRPHHLCTLVYTSGTTGRPKGVRLAHTAWTFEGASVEATGLLSADDVQYLWLPLAHVFGQVLLACQLQLGFVSAIDGRVDRIIDNVAVIRPTFMGAAPRIFEKAYARITTTVADDGGVKAKLFAWAEGLGLRVSRLRQQGKEPTGLLAARYALADRLVFAKIRARFGGRIRFFVSGSAALNKELAEWFHAAGLLILEGYGLTESSAGTVVNRPDRYKFGSVGIPLDGMEVRIADDGEILFRGEGNMDGYQNRDAETKEALVDGWLHTGDIGLMDGDFLIVTDRKKDLIKTSNGKYVAPTEIEGRFKKICPYVGEFIVHGNDRNFVTALVTLDPDAITEWAEKNGVSGSYADIVGSDAARTMVQGYVDELNAGLNRWEQIKKFTILDKELTVEDGEVTPSMKVKRRHVEKRYSDQLDAMYR